MAAMQESADICRADNFPTFCDLHRLVYDLWKLKGQSPSGPEHNPNVVLSRLFCKQTDGQMWVTPQLMLTPLTTNYLFVCGAGPGMVFLSLWDQYLTYFQTS